MARRTLPSPKGRRAVTAYSCGARMAEWQTTLVADLANRGDQLADYMTAAERAAYRRGKPASWWCWWWQGYRHGRIEQT